MSEIILMSDPRITGVPVRECGEPLVDLRALKVLQLDERLADAEGAYAHLRRSVVDRLVAAQSLLPRGLRLLIVEGYRPLEVQRRYFEEYLETMRTAHPGWAEDRLRRQASRYIAPPETAPHVAGAAVDLTLMTDSGTELPMGTEINADPEECDDACYTGSPAIGSEPARDRAILASALTAVDLVNYPTEWWHWSYGDRYWAFARRAPAAHYGPARLARRPT
ncbi:D-alanyl-D-alanine dipeptidase [Planomonospora parontospora subsp. parontospora]|uniref:D-alanyl-D-alanine dipeptidase n=2 Tax=Planomonospora parontospora TaxID=58119 RepID=A0AA37BM51_9ACTN|nr:M15 family metallopeptidase [Planomonospora parontospora]GGK93215.1 D-alanyl-D-alanine dipeptidase [Planomonospora parontospora]GII12243.1 D-alanyl-D-alanine dipeptidase [Planomonospora parontospora subsp. parontospora]